MKTFGVIYKITNIINNKIYIGQTSNKDPEKYIRKHFENALKSNLNGNKYFYNAIRKYGPENFRYEIIAECNSKKELNDAEVGAIFINKSFGEDGEHFDTEFGYNMTKGGDGGIGGPHFKGNHHSEESKSKMSKSRKGKKHPYQPKPSLRGDKNPAKREEVRKKNSESQKRNHLLGIGKPKTEEAKNKQKTAFGKIWITKEIDDQSVEKYIKQEDVEHFLNMGWIKGRKKKIGEVSHLCRKTLPNPTKGKIWIHNKLLNKRKRICKSQVEVYISNGWELGNLPGTFPSRKGKIKKIIPEETMKLIIDDRKKGYTYPELIEKYGYKMDLLRSRLKGVV